MRNIVMKCLTNGVYIVTTADNGQINGVTRSWLTQLSYEPTLIGVAIAPLRKCHGMIVRSGQFAVNVLGQDQVDLAARFGFTTGRQVDKFQGIDIEHTAAGLPLLPQALAYIDCNVVETIDIGDHTLFVGQVTEAEILDQEAAPLVFNPADYF
ncbi:MAG: flavin reductase [Deltaproteobacteria bacterium]|nr:flavin reductase [Deltaproteobacteria bacterium]MBW2070397.1 flavin reductase [Deltaproteobacteria bacterium]